MKNSMMEIIITVLGAIVAAANAGNLLDMGPVEVQITVGHVSDKYSPLTPVDTKASKNGLQYIVSRKAYKDLNPFKASSLPDFPFSNDVITSTTKVQSVVVDHIKDAQVENVEFRMKSPFRIDVDVSVPLLVVNVDFHVDFTAAGVSDSVNGHALVKLNDVKAPGAAVQAMASDVYQLRGVLGSVKVSNLQLQLTLDKYKEYEDNQQFLSTIMYEVQSAVGQYVANYALDVANGEFKKYTKKQVDDYLAK